MKIIGNSIQFDNGFNITLHRTIRLPEDGKTHALPPSNGAFPMKRIEDFKDKVPAAWRGHGGVFIPMYAREAMWLGFSGPTSAVKVATGKVNAVSGQPWKPELQAVATRANKVSHDYMVAPRPQPWLDGFNTGDGTIRQFVAMQMGQGYTVEAQVTGKEDVGGIQILVVPAKPGRLPEPKATRILESYAMAASVDATASASMDGWGEDFYLPSKSLGNPIEQSLGAKPSSTMRSAMKSALPKAAEMGLAQGGRMTQEVYADPHGIDTWDQEKAERIFVHIVNAELWEKITGEKCPPCPIAASEYDGAWYDYKTNNPTVGASSTLSQVKTVAEKDKQHGFTGQQDDSSLNETPKVKNLTPKSKNEISDGNW